MNKAVTSHDLQQVERCPHCFMSLTDAKPGQHGPEGCDSIPVYDGSKLIGWRPNYDKPGVTEAVERGAFDDHMIANGSRMSRRERDMAVRRFNESMRQRYGQEA